VSSVQPIRSRRARLRAVGFLFGITTFAVLIAHQRSYVDQLRDRPARTSMECVCGLPHPVGSVRASLRLRLSRRRR
jgi:hypothetical protein